MKVMTTACAMLLTVLFAFAALPVFAQDADKPSKLIPPVRVRLELFAVTPIPVEEPLSPEARAIIEQLEKNKKYIGVILTSPSGGSLVAKYQPMSNAVCWFQPGAQIISVRRGKMTGRLEVKQILNDGLVLSVLEQGVGIAPGDHIFMLNEFATVIPRLSWTPVPGATGYRVERRRHTADETIDYAGGQHIHTVKTTSIFDPSLRDALGTNVFYDYYIQAIRGSEISEFSRAASSNINWTPLRPVIAKCCPTLHRGTPEYTAALLDALQHHPSPGMRLSAAWEIGNLRDAALLPQLTPLLNADDPELAANAKLAVGMIKPRE